MSKPGDNPADPFKKALAEATKVMANDADLTVTYTVDPSGVSGETCATTGQPPHDAGRGVGGTWHGRRAGTLSPLP